MLVPSVQVLDLLLLHFRVLEALPPNPRIYERVPVVKPRVRGLHGIDEAWPVLLLDVLRCILPELTISHREVYDALFVYHWTFCDLLFDLSVAPWAA